MDQLRVSYALENILHPLNYPLLPLHSLPNIPRPSSMFLLIHVQYYIYHICILYCNDTRPSPGFHARGVARKA